MKTLSEHNDAVLEQRKQQRRKTGLACDKCGLELLIENAPAKPAPYDPALIQVPVKCDACDRVKYMYIPRTEWACIQIAEVKT